MVKHVALDYDATTGVGKITGVKWKADHLYSHILAGVKSRTLLVEFPNGKAYTPGDTDPHNIDACKTQLAKNHLDVTHWRLTAYAGGNETTGSATETLTIYNIGVEFRYG